MPAVRVIIRVAAGPRLGYGHLVRARSLARALGGAVIAVRGGAGAREAAARLGIGIGDEPFEQLLTSVRPDVVVIDDPSIVHARGALDVARRYGRPVVSVHDLGVAPIASDLAIDGTIEPGDYETAGQCCRGPRFAVLDPGIARARESVPPRQKGRVLIALGGGPRRHAAEAIAAAVLAAHPDVRVRVAGGFARPDDVGDDTGPIRWIGPRPTLVAELQQCEVAIVAGGVTLYEAAALGTPVVGVAVVRAQEPTILGFARRGAVLDGGFAAEAGRCAGRARAIGEAAARLLNEPHRRALAAHRASILVDGLGAFRAADAISALARNAGSLRRAG